MLHVKSLQVASLHPYLNAKHMQVNICQSKYNIALLLWDPGASHLHLRNKCYGSRWCIAVLLSTDCNVLKVITLKPSNRKSNSGMSCSQGWLCFSLTDLCADWRAHCVIYSDLSNQCLAMIALANYWLDFVGNEWTTGVLKCLFPVEI